jgi:hypothetical protein
MGFIPENDEQQRTKHIKKRQRGPKRANHGIMTPNTAMISMAMAIEGIWFRGECGGRSGRQLQRG